MKIGIKKLLLFAVFVVTVILLCSCENSKILFRDTITDVEPDPDTHIKVETAGEGYDVYKPLSNVGGYRYGPSIIYYPDGSCDAWFATNGLNGEWDWISYKHSEDGVTWGEEQIVLRPTPDSMDHYSCCDPGVIYFNGYYYLGYTSTIVNTNGGINNNIFVARSKSPTGPFEKWNGEGWGGDPAPLIYFDEDDRCWGAGEPSFVVVDDVLYIYYTVRCSEGNFLCVANSDTSENWPSNLNMKGYVYSKSGSEDSSDVIYVEDVGKFLAFNTYDRFSSKAGICILESDDGINFTQSDILHEGVCQYLHNMGISKRPDGHVQLKDNLFVGYGYSDGNSNNWGHWATRFQPITLSIVMGESVMSDQSIVGVLRDDYFGEMPDDPEPIVITSTTVDVEIYKGDIYYLSFVYYDTYLQSHSLDDYKKIKYTGYDKKIISIKDGKITTLSVGETTITAKYGKFVNTIKVKVRDASFIIDDPDPTIVSFTPVSDEYIVSVSGEHKKQIRAFVEFSNGDWGEGYNDSVSQHSGYTPKVEGKKYPITYEVADTTICEVNDRGIITPKSIGTTTVKVATIDGFEFTVTVIVN